ncbi:MAG TPA: DNA topoisomerase I, partial [Nitrososphaera sp.]
MYTLVVCEKPDAARRIAKALGSTNETKVAGVPVFDVDFQDKHYKVCSAVGHLYGISDSTKNRSVYPVLDLEWAPIEGRARVINAISKLSRDADSFVHACDYDQEGEVIGHSILQYACGGVYGKSKRAKFSTLTDDEIRESFAGLKEPSAGLAEAGRSRHLLDFIYGVNLSRALAQSFKAGNKGYRNLSIGRVQGPTLAFAADREQEIRLFVPDPYWVVTADFEKNGQIIHARYEKLKVETLAEAQTVVDMCIEKDCRVAAVEKKKIPLRPPAPFSTGDLQREAYRLFRVSPGYTLAIAEKLYLRALISYPRTSSQKLPASINYRKILSGLARSSLYGSASLLLSKSALVPHEGPMTDPAHPAIYPTGVFGKLSGLEFKIYDLIVKRFLATFGDAAVTEKTNVAVDVAGHSFVAEGNVMLYEGWTALYRPYARIDQTMLPPLAIDDALQNRQVAMEEKFTQPPPRYSQSSLLARMEHENIGTKATRADIIATLFKRKYLEQ